MQKKWTQCILVLNRFISTLCLFINVNPSALMMDLCFPPAVKMTKRSASFQNYTGSSKNLEWENKAGNTDICSFHKRQDFPQGQPLSPLSPHGASSAKLGHKADTEQSPRQSSDFICASSDQGQLEWSQIYSRLTCPQSCAPSGIDFPSQETVNLSLPFVGRKGNAALI